MLALIYMSHPGASQTYGIQVFEKTEENENRTVPLYRILLKYAKDARADGLVVGATRPSIIREIASAKLAPIFSPGFGSQGGDLSEASKNGVDYFIVGRSITKSSEPSKTLNFLKDTLRKC